MLNTPEIKDIYKEIQKKLYYMIPEKWERLYLYAAITEKAYQMPIGEMYFYYFPKSILKKNAVNVYEIPAKFNIDERKYMQLVKNLYGSIERIREKYIENNQKLWTNITISIENFKFKIEYNYEPLDNSEYSNYDRHVIWRYEHLGIDINSINKKERKIIENYLINKQNGEEYLKEEYEDGVYKVPVHNMFDYNTSSYETPLELHVMEEFEAEHKPINNQILLGSYRNNKNKEEIN